MVSKAYRCKRCKKVSKGKEHKGITSFHKKHRCPGCGSFYFSEIDIFDDLIFDFEELIFDYEGEYIPENPESYIEEELIEDPEGATMRNEDLEADDPLREDDGVMTCQPSIDDDTSKQSSSFGSGSSSFGSGSSSFDSGSSSFDSGSSSYDSGSSCDSGSSD